jgi:hypothetical protein
MKKPEFNFFADCKTKDQVRKLFFKLCLQLHPDKGGEHNTFIRMKNEYEIAIDFFPAEENSTFSTENELSLSEMVEKLCRIRGIGLELCGLWIWVSGDTFAAKNLLKELGLKFSGSKKAWYWFSGIDQETKKRASKKSLNQIRNIFGSEKIETVSANTQLKMA